MHCLHGKGKKDTGINKYIPFMAFLSIHMYRYSTCTCLYCIAFPVEEKERKKERKMLRSFVWKERIENFYPFFL